MTLSVTSLLFPRYLIRPPSLSADSTPLMEERRRMKREEPTGAEGKSKDCCPPANLQVGADEEAAPMGGFKVFVVYADSKEKKQY